MGKKNKKKGTGAEKTARKTEKKQSNKLKKELEKLGEDDIESILAQIEKEEQKRVQVTEAVVEAPSRRLDFSFIPHPDKEQLILYGGELFNGSKTFIYNDLFFYNIPTATWSVVKAPNGPKPRSGHQMVATSANKGQLWMFGGEYASPSQSQFYHYKDLWVYHLSKKQWEKVQAPNGPSARSGHRMVFQKKNLVVFGGFYDNLRECKYYNDVHIFNTETYTWTKLQPTGTGPAPRSACCMAALNDGRILVYGGYYKEHVKENVDKGQVFTNAFLLTPDKNDTTGTKWKWVQTKLGGAQISPRCSMSMTSTPNNASAYCFGGVFDKEENCEILDISGNFFNDFYQLDLEKLTWKTISVTGKKEKKRKNNEEQPQEEEMEVVETLKEATISDDGIFKVTVGPSSSQISGGKSSPVENASKVFQPSPRAKCGVAIKHGVLYLYGGLFEEDDKEICLKDFYSIDLKKLDEWKVLISDDVANIEWIDSGGEESSEEDIDEEDESSEEDMEAD